MGREIADSDRLERAHLASAGEFVEYGLHARTQNGAISVSDFAFSTAPLAELAATAWPFVRGGYMRLVKPSSRAREALHPIALPKPALGRGLPSWRAHYRLVQQSEDGLLLAFGSAANLDVYRSRDQGLTWHEARRSAAKHFSERCSGPDYRRAFTFGLDDRTHAMLVVSEVPERPVFRTQLAPSEHEVFATACDDEALVAAVRREDHPDVTLYQCRHSQRCRPMPLPKLCAQGLCAGYSLDVARVEGATIVAISTRSIVRVASSRDDGETWTPFSIAYDGDAYPELGGGAAVRGRLLALDGRVLLYAGAEKRFQTYPVLASDDYGASWRAP
jgi:hypothetical protein